MEWGRLRDEITGASVKFGDLLRTAPAATTIVPPSSWSVAELGAHLVSLPRRYTRMLDDDQAAFPERVSALNQAEIEAIGPRDPKQLADLLEADSAELLNLLGHDGDRAVLFYGVQSSVVGVGGALLGELLVHGRDLARMLGKAWELRSEQALAVANGVLPWLANFVNPEVAERAAGTYHLRLRGGDDWTIRVRDGGAVIERQRPGSADLHISAEPVAYLLVGFQRMSLWRAVLSGRMVAWGRKPWLGLQFSKVFAET
jgi:uncharacterized protein (TIGR03083 family)